MCSGSGGAAGRGEAGDGCPSSASPDERLDSACGASDETIVGRRKRMVETIWPAAGAATPEKIPGGARGSSRWKPPNVADERMLCADD